MRVVWEASVWQREREREQRGRQDLFLFIFTVFPYILDASFSVVSRSHSDTSGYLALMQHL